MAVPYSIAVLIVGGGVGQHLSLLPSQKSSFKSLFLLLSFVFINNIIGEV